MNDNVVLECGEFDSHTTTKYNNMKIYSEIELREMISNLRLVKDFYEPEESIAGLADESELDLTTYELLLENHLEDKLIKNIKL